jgi:hypothetical protein
MIGITICYGVTESCAALGQASVPISVSNESTVVATGVVVLREDGGRAEVLVGLDRRLGQLTLLGARRQAADDGSYTVRAGPAGGGGGGGGGG